MSNIRCIRAGWLLDGSGGPVQTDVLMTIESGRIAAIEANRGQVVCPEAERVDHGDAMLLPPLADVHLHLAMSGTTEPKRRERQLVADCDELAPLIERHLRQLADHGVLAVRDGGDRGGCVLAYLQKLGDGVTGPVLVQSPGAAWHRQGRYGALIGGSLAGDQSLAEAAAVTRRDLPFIKVVNSGLNSLIRYGRQTPPQFGSDDLARLVAMADKAGRKVMVHANGEQPVREAVEAGCHSIEHGFFMGRDNLSRMAERGCIWVATACTMKAYAEIMEHAGDKASASVARKNLDHQLEQLRLARELGVTVALGTDAGSPGVVHGEAVAVELALLLEAGYPPVEAMHAATCAGARLMGIEKDFGLLAPGRTADFLVVQSTPSNFDVSRERLIKIYLGGHTASFGPSPGA